MDALEAQVVKEVKKQHKPERLTTYELVQSVHCKISELNKLSAAVLVYQLKMKTDRLQMKNILTVSKRFQYEEPDDDEIETMKKAEETSDEDMEDFFLV